MTESSNVLKQSHGHIEVICGSMFSGKTEELIRRLRRAQIAKQNVAIFKPSIDNRFSDNEIVSHSYQRIPSVSVGSPDEILLHTADADVIGIDEAQFFDLGLIEVCQKLADKGKRVIVAGLDTDYRGVPFEPIPQLLAIAEYITKTLAVCMQCGAPANRTQRITRDSRRVVIGSEDVYEARCRVCFEPPEDK